MVNSKKKKSIVMANMFDIQKVIKQIELEKKFEEENLENKN